MKSAVYVSVNSSDLDTPPTTSTTYTPSSTRRFKPFLLTTLTFSLLILLLYTFKNSQIFNSTFNLNSLLRKNISDSNSEYHDNVSSEKGGDGDFFVRYYTDKSRKGTFVNDRVGFSWGFELVKEPYPTPQLKYLAERNLQLDVEDEEKKEEELGFVMKDMKFYDVNTVNNRVEERRRNMEAFDKFRVEHCGDSKGKGKWIVSDADDIKVKYAKNTIDYALTYTSYNQFRDIVQKLSGKISTEEEMEFEKVLSEAGYGLETYYVGRKFCEGIWTYQGYEGTHISIERLGPFYSVGDYDWNTVLTYKTIPNEWKKSQKPQKYIHGTFFAPVLSNGSIISYPPLHVHHTHLYPFEPPEMHQKINIVPRHLHKVRKELAGDSTYLEQLIRKSGPLLQTDEVKRIEAKALEKLTSVEKLMERYDDMESVMQATHHVIIQGHGDAECLENTGGADCLFNLLPPHHGFRVFNSTAFDGNFEVNDVRKTTLTGHFNQYLKNGKDKLKQFVDSKVFSLKDSSNPIKTRWGHALKKIKNTGSDLDIFKYSQNMLEFYVDIGIIWSEEPEKSEEEIIPITFLQFGNPPIGLAWMTYLFPLDENTNLVFYNYTNFFMGSGTLTNFVLHSHMSYLDSIFVIKGSNVYTALNDFVDNRQPFIFECSADHKTQTLEENKRKVLQVALNSGTDVELLCQGLKPSLQLYCNRDELKSEVDFEDCIFRDRRIEFSCKENARLEELETLTVIAFNKVRPVTTKAGSNTVDFKKRQISRSDDENSLAIRSTFGYHFAAHQHSFFRGDFVSDKFNSNTDKSGTTSRRLQSSGFAEVDYLLDNFHPPSYFQYASWDSGFFDDSIIDKMTKTCPSEINFASNLPWENLFDI